jgi:hypothetical protein
VSEKTSPAQAALGALEIPVYDSRQFDGEERAVGIKGDWMLSANYTF